MPESQNGSGRRGLVLICQDLRFVASMCRDILMAAGLEAVIAESVPESEALFDEHRDNIIGVMMDACLPGYIPNTAPLVTYMRRSGYEGPILGCSTKVEYLREAGCDPVTSDTPNYAEWMIHILGLGPEPTPTQ